MNGRNHRRPTKSESYVVKLPEVAVLDNAPFVIVKAVRLQTIGKRFRFRPPFLIRLVHRFPVREVMVERVGARGSLLS